ncbi:MAG: type III secretion system chaperone [Kiritimatiellae bacterium]|nr:type III secretion system chaperone [Kiritimatiellia bacterium]
MQFEELINGFAGRFGIAEGQINDGAAVFDIDGMTVGFVNDETAATVMVVAEIGYPPPDANGKLGEVMLKSNYLYNGSNGAVLCMNPETSAYALMQTWALDPLDVETFAKNVESFINNAEKWKDVLLGMRTAESAKEDMDNTEKNDLPEDEGTFPSGSFLRV